MDTPTMKHRLPPLPYALMALEPHMDAPTLALHHDLHHAGYVNTLNRLLESGPDFLRDKSAEWLLLNLSQVPDGIRESVRNNAGGHVNHSMLWRAMTPRAGGAPTGPLAEHIDSSFGSFEKFKVQFEEAGSRHFGSGWVWLVKTSREDEKLQVLTTAGHDNPMAQRYQPFWSTTSGNTPTT